MIQAAHVVLYSREPDLLRAFFRNMLQFPAVDEHPSPLAGAGSGWNGVGRETGGRPMSRAGEGRR